MKCDSNKNQSCLARCCHSTTYRTQGRSPDTIIHKADIAHPLNKSDKNAKPERRSSQSFLMISVWMAATPLTLLAPITAKWPMRIFLTSPSSTILKAAIMGPSPYLRPGISFLQKNEYFCKTMVDVST